MFRQRLLGTFAVVGVLAAAGCSSTKSKPALAPSTSRTTSSSSATPTPSADPQAQAVLDDLNELITEETKMFDSATPDQGIYNYAADGAVTYLLNAVETDRSHGVKFTGTPVLRKLQPPVISNDTTPPSATVTACLDETNWTTVYLTDPSKKAGTGTPTSHPLTVKFEKKTAGWRATEYAVDGNTTC